MFNKQNDEKKEAKKTENLGAWIAVFLLLKWNRFAQIDSERDGEKECREKCRTTNNPTIDFASAAWLLYTHCYSIVMFYAPSVSLNEYIVFSRFMLLTQQNPHTPTVCLNTVRRFARSSKSHSHLDKKEIITLQRHANEKKQHQLAALICSARKCKFYLCVSVCNLPTSRWQYWLIVFTSLWACVCVCKHCAPHILCHCAVNTEHN